MVNGIDEIAVTNLDGLDSLETIRVCTHYRFGGQVMEVPPSDVQELSTCEPVYEELPGWKTPTDAARSWNDLPAPAQRYLERLAELTGAKLAIASVGPNREQTIVL